MRHNWPGDAVNWGMTMTDHETEEDTALAPFFAAMQRNDEAPDEALIARVLADAGCEQAQPARRHATDRPGLAVRLAAMMRDLGGWPACAGLASAAVAGVWIGVAAPEPFSSVARDLLGTGQTGGALDMAALDFFTLDEGGTQ